MSVRKQVVVVRRQRAWRHRTSEIKGSGMRLGDQLIGRQRARKEGESVSCSAGASGAFSRTGGIQCPAGAERDAVGWMKVLLCSFLSSKEREKHLRYATRTAAAKIVCIHPCLRGSEGHTRACVSYSEASPGLPQKDDSRRIL